MKQGSKSGFLYWYGDTPIGVIDRLTCDRNKMPEWQTTIREGEFDATLDCSTKVQWSENVEDGETFEDGGDPDRGGAGDLFWR